MDFLISFSINLIFLIYWFLKVKKENKFVNLIVFLNVLSPGFFIKDTLINLSDILVPILFVLFFLKNKFILVNKKMPLLCSLNLILLSIIFSFLSAAYTSSLSITMLFRGLRFLEFILSIVILYNEIICKNSLQYVFKITYTYSLLLMVLCFGLFFYQDSNFASIQSMWIGSLELKRAGGIYKESSSFGFSCLLVSILALYSIDKKYKIKLSWILLILSIINNIISYTRISNLALVAVLIIWFFHKINKTKVLAASIFLILLILLITTVPIIREFFTDRILGLFVNSLETSSSGRFDVWSNTIDVFIKSNKITFGLGYKYDFVLCDNCFLFALTNLGIFGLICYILFLFNIFLYFINSQKYSTLCLFIALFVMSLTCDVLTYTRGLFVLFIILLITKNKTNNITLLERR